VTTINELIAQAQGDAASAGKNDALVKLSGDEPTPLVFGLLLKHLGQDDNRRGVHLAVQGAGTHYLSRPKLLKLVSVKSRGLGFGDSGGFQTPGEGNDRLIKLCCKQSDCSCTFYVINYDEDKPPSCDQHADTYMEPC
jgi:hypothetical protein